MSGGLTTSLAIFHNLTKHKQNRQFEYLLLHELVEYIVVDVIALLKADVSDIRHGSQERDERRSLQDFHPLKLHFLQSRTSTDEQLQARVVDLPTPLKEMKAISNLLKGKAFLFLLFSVSFLDFFSPFPFLFYSFMNIEK